MTEPRIAFLPRAAEAVAGARGNSNPGENRYQAAVQAGYSHRLGPRGNAMTAFDAQRFGDNNAYLHGSRRIGTLEQPLLYNWQVAFS